MLRSIDYKEKNKESLLMEEGLLIRGGKRDSQPFLLKLGFALAVSFTTYLASQFLSRIKLPTKLPSGDDGSKESSTKSSAIAARGLKDELDVITSEETLANIINGASTTTLNTATIAGEEGFFLPEFNKVVMNGFEVTPDKNNVKIVEKGLEFEERDEMEKENAYLKNLVEELKERERSLEIQMIEYYGLKEQEASLRELENRLKVSATEHKLLTLKIESLQADNRKLRAQVSDYPKLVSEFGSAREESELLKKKMKADGEHAKEKLAALHHKITEMLCRERERGENDMEIEKKLKRLEELEVELKDLRMVNSRLAEENLNFAELLESMKMDISSHRNSQEVAALEIARNLREENENLKTEIEQLQTDRCTDVEELVYLRWINACLRYELRNYQPPTGKTVARDLSKCLSPESERKAKQLILEYANSGTDEKHISLSLFDFDTESCTSSQTSSDEHSDASFDVSSSTKNSGPRKSKLVSKLKKLVLGKDRKGRKVSSVDMNERGNSPGSISSSISVEKASTNQRRKPRASLDVQGMRRLDLEVQESIAERCISDLGTSRGHMRMISEDCLSDMGDTLDHEDAAVREKVKLKKFADVLKGSVKSKRRPISFS